MRRRHLNKANASDRGTEAMDRSIYREVFLFTTSLQVDMRGPMKFLPTLCKLTEKKGIQGINWCLKDAVFGYFHD